MDDPATVSGIQRILQRLGLHRPELRAWAMYDWANSAMVTTIVTTVFPIYYLHVAAEQLAPAIATQRFAIATTISLLLVAVVAPLLGALADSAPVKKLFLGMFLTLGVLATGGMFFIHHGDWQLALGLFVLADIGACGSFIFYDALLRHVARDDEIDGVSTTGYALGYLGGGILLACNIAWIQNPQWFGLPSGSDLSEAQQTLPTRLAFLSVSLWWLVFAIPLFLRIAEPPIETAHHQASLPVLARSVAHRLMETYRSLREYKHALLMLAAFLAYNDGIGTIIRLAAIYGAEIGIDSAALIGSILVVQFVGIPCSILFGVLAGWIGTKRTIYSGLIVYLGITMLAYHLQNATQFFVLAVLVGLVQGGTQALSRSLFASMIPRKKSTEFFALFSLSEKFAGMLGPLFFTATVYLTGSSRNGILSVVIFFVAGGILLSKVDVEEGRRLARLADNGESK
jgi:UMF1 family MFS transporter